MIRSYRKSVYSNDSLRAALLALILLAAAPPTHATNPWSTQTMDTAGQSHILGKSPDTKAIVVIFLGSECPISIAEIPEINRVAAEFKNQVEVYAVVSDPSVTRAAAGKFAADYSVKVPLLFDASGALLTALLPKVTPEAFVFTKGTLTPLYRGRINDAFVDLGKPRAIVSQHDLETALTAILQNRNPAAAETTPVGCTITVPRDVKDHAVTYTRDIAPILSMNCISCHRADQVAPFVLTSYQEAAKHADMLAQVTDSRYMPPWKPEPNYGHFLDERRLGATDIAALAAWAKAGAPEGNPADLPALPAFPAKWSLGTPDMIIKVKKPFKIPAHGPDIFEAFVIPLNLQEDRYLTGFDYHPGNRRVVHHMIGFLDDAGAAQKLADTKGDGSSYTSFGGTGFLPTGAIGGWAPGAEPHLLPSDIARLVKKGSDLVLQTHYHPDGKAEEDQSEIALYFAKAKPARVLMGWPLGTLLINIPAGEAHYTRAAQIVLPADITMRGITPHMHLLGKEMKVTATKPDGTVVPLIWIKDWDFNWQGQYEFTAPIPLPKGTTIALEAVYDNSTDNPRNPSDPPKRVIFGEQTTNEMCFCFLQFTLDNPADIGKMGPFIARRLQRGI